jgi:hypothetical protein
MKAMIIEDWINNDKLQQRSYTTSEFGFGRIGTETGAKNSS